LSSAVIGRHMHAWLLSHQLHHTPKLPSAEFKNARVSSCGVSGKGGATVVAGVLVGAACGARPPDEKLNAPAPVGAGLADHKPEP